MNDAMRRLDPLAGEWDVTMTRAWFLDSMDTEIHGTASEDAGRTWRKDLDYIFERRA